MRVTNKRIFIGNRFLFRPSTYFLASVVLRDESSRFHKPYGMALSKLTGSDWKIEDNKILVPIAHVKGTLYSGHTLEIKTKNIGPYLKEFHRLLEKPFENKEENLKEDPSDPQGIPKAIPGD